MGSSSPDELPFRLTDRSFKPPPVAQYGSINHYFNTIFGGG
jgi:hypothetical protein